jgi:hypothetical protein
MRKSSICDISPIEIYYLFGIQRYMFLMNRFKEISFTRPRTAPEF